MSDDDPRAALVESGFAAINRADFEEVYGLLHPSVSSHVSDRLMNSGTWKGADGFAEMLAGWFEPWEQLHFELLELRVLDASNVLISVRQSAVGAGSGVPVMLDVVNLLAFEGERLIRFEVHPDEAAALAAV